MLRLLAFALLGLITSILCHPYQSATNASMVDLEGRGIIMRDCSPDRQNQVQRALKACGDLAAQAAWYAVGGDDAQFYRYFKTLDPKIRDIVAYRFAAISNECSGLTTLTKNFCADDGTHACKSNYIAVTYGVQIVRCDWYWKLPFLSDKCHGEDQVTKTIHEMSHVKGLYGPITTDYPGAYGWPGVTTLNGQQAYMNADNYAFYANAIRMGKDC